MRGATCGGRRLLRRVRVSIHAPHARGDNTPYGPVIGVSSFNPRPSCEGRPVFYAVLHVAVVVSIHAPHARGDVRGRRRGRGRPVSIHAPHARGDPAPRARGVPRQKFQSTPLMRGATAAPGHAVPERLVSIHAPHARGDRIAASASARFPFQSTPLMRGATARCCETLNITYPI